MSRHLMLLPSMNCPASCKYCFGPHEGGPSMRLATVEAVARWQSTFYGDEALEITFHGGEPLVAGAPFYNMALPLLCDDLSPRDIRFGIQSNLWLLTDELCELFCEYGVSIGTSLDGPKPINDAQRGQGYFERTMTGLQRARAYGMGVGCICTFTSRSAEHAGDVFDFFAHEGIDFSIHAALPAIDHPENGWTLSPEAHGQLLVDMLGRYLANLDVVRISTLDAICRSISTGHGGICTFGDCLGEYLAVDPQGWIYACQRFAGMPQHRLGNVHDCPSPEELAATPAWHRLHDRQEHIEEECGSCSHLAYCRGGCPYNILAVNGNRFDQTLRDPHCPAYKRVFDQVTERALEQVFSEQNLLAVVEDGPGDYGLMRKGPLLELMRGDPHPRKAIHQARELVAAVALGASESPVEALNKLDCLGLVKRPERALGSLKALQDRLDTQSQQGLVNVYIHCTYDCNLTCNHCYAKASPGASPAMAVDDMARLVREAAALGFRKAVITGGEPLVHLQRDVLLDTLAALRDPLKPLQTVIRTNLAYPLTTGLVDKLAHSSDQVVVSVDGNQASHDSRRGMGTYALTVANLRELLSAHPTASVYISAVLPPDQARGPAGDAVRALGEELGIMTRFKMVLPLGRGLDLGLLPAYYGSFSDASENLGPRARIASTCGLGMNLYVEPNGGCYPCYALMGEGHRLGNALDEGLVSVLRQNDAYRQVTVDSNKKCRTCSLRYLCGGFCRAWRVEDDPNSPPVDCDALYHRALQFLNSALGVLDISVDRWSIAGLPQPEITPQDN